MYGNGFDGFHMLWGGGLLMLLFWVGVLLLVIWGVRAIFSDHREPQRSLDFRSPLEIAQARYARGEISQDEYLKIVDNLRLAEDISHKTKRSED